MNLTYVFEHGDSVLVSTFLLLVAMSAASWYVIVWKFCKLRRERSRLRTFQRKFVRSPDWPLHYPYGAQSGGVGLLLAEAERTAGVAARYAGEERREVMATHLTQTLDTIRAWLDRGLTILASVGSSAPFIGLFGTVWGVYNALTQIAAAGNASLNVVAGPMGEALVMTAVGLFAAIPAVLAYNAFVRMNRLLVQDLRHIAEQLALYSTCAEAGESLKVVKGAR
jgi:biopolymer transport protein ExbB